MKKTVGQLLQEHDQKDLRLEDEVTEYTLAMSPEIMDMVLNTAKQTKEHPNYAGKNFYIQVLHFILPVMLRPVFKVFARFSCPTPSYNQSVFKFTQATDTLDFLWTLPSKERYEHIILNPREYLDDPVRKSIAETVFADHSGELLRIVMKENGDKPDAIIYNCKERACLTKSLIN